MLHIRSCFLKLYYPLGHIKEILIAVSPWEPMLFSCSSFTLHKKARESKMVAPPIVQLDPCFQLLSTFSFSVCVLWYT